jgi:hypothetical protein
MGKTRSESRQRELTKTTYLLNADFVYKFCLMKFYYFKSKVGSVSMRVKGMPVSRRFFGDVVIRFLQRHRIPFQVSYARKTFLRRITVLDIPRLKQLIQPENEEKVIEELEDITLELLNEYSREGAMARQRRKAKHVIEDKKQQLSPATI